MQKYNIKKIIGQFNERELPNGSKIFGYTGTQEILNLELVGKERENRFLHSFAQKYKMTNTQFLRFLTHIKTQKQGQTYDEIAQEVIRMDKENNPPKKL